MAEALVKTNVHERVYTAAKVGNVVGCVGKGVDSFRQLDKHTTYRQVNCKTNIEKQKSMTDG